MPCEIIERMATCDDCRTLALEYGTALIGSRRPRAIPNDWGLPLAITRGRMDDHLITAHSTWLPSRQPDCHVCELWREDHVIGPIEEAEALHRADHLCEPLREVCIPGNYELTHLVPSVLGIEGST